MKDKRSDATLNRIIAEWCRSKIPDSGVSVPDTGNIYPQYASDLNAMHEAQKKLSKIQEEKYIVTLCLEIQPVPNLWNASARQRAEAMVAVIESK